MQKITPMLWFDNQAEEAANFYVSVFKNSKVKQITHYAGEEFSKKKGQDAAGLQRVTHEVWQMKKLDLAKLEKAFAGK